MKLNKSKLIDLTKAGLSQLGYKEVKDTITSAQGLYIKLVKTDFYLTLGLTISRYYDNMFTASFYLSKTTIWATYGGDIPKTSYQRVGLFLTNKEREELLDEEYSIEGVKDAWWNSGDTTSIGQFLEAVKITEDRFLNQIDLFAMIEHSDIINELQNLAKKTIRMAEKKNIDQDSFDFIPTKTIDDIPIVWFKAAEKVIKDENAILNINTVKRLAADAYRQKMIAPLG